MHGLGLEHEFKIVTDENKILENFSIRKLISDSVNSIDWKNREKELPGGWLLRIKKFLKEDKKGKKDKKVIIDIDEIMYKEDIKIIYFYFLKEKVGSFRTTLNNTHYVAYINDNKVDVKYLYLFLGISSFPSLDKISITLDDIYLIRNPELVIIKHKEKCDCDRIQIGKKKTVSSEEYRYLDFNYKTLTLFQIYNFYKKSDVNINNNLNVNDIFKLLMLTNSGIIEDEHQNLIEMKNLHYKDIKNKDVINFHKENTKFLQTMYNNVYEHNVTITDSQYVENNEVYSGSYHVWFTLPKVINMERDVANYHSVSLLQWIEPLIFTYGLNDINYKCKSTFRMCGNNIYSGFGSTDPEKLLGKTKTISDVINIIDYVKYDNGNFHFDNDQIFLRKKELKDIITDINDEDIYFIEGSKRVDNILFNSGSKTYFDYIEEFSGTKIPEKTIGNDIRFEKNYIDILLTRNSDGNLTYVYETEHGLNFNMTKQEKFNKRHFAFEVRFFDNSSLDLMQYKIDSMLLVFQHAIKTKFDEGWCFLDDDWNRAMAESLYHGHTTVLNSEYLNKINLFFNTDLSIYLSLEDFWYELIEILYQRYNKSKVYKSFS